jgi:hypothetical protein
MILYLNLSDERRKTDEAHSKLSAEKDLGVTR